MMATTPKEAHVDWDALAHPCPINSSDRVISMKDLPAHFQLEELLKDELWVCHNYKPEGEDDWCWLQFAFLEHHSTEIEENGEDGETEVKVLLHGDGPVGALRECRHTYWGVNGYLFHFQRLKIEAALKWLSKHFDLD